MLPSAPISPNYFRLNWKLILWLLSRKIILLTDLIYFYMILLLLIKLILRLYSVTVNFGFHGRCSRWKLYSVIGIIQKSGDPCVLLVVERIPKLVRFENSKRNGESEPRSNKVVFITRTSDAKTSNKLFAQ